MGMVHTQFCSLGFYRRSRQAPFISPQGLHQSLECGAAPTSLVAGPLLLYTLAQQQDHMLAQQHSQAFCFC